MCVKGDALNSQMMLSQQSPTPSKQMLFEPSSRSVPYRVGVNNLHVLLVSFSFVTLSYWFGYHLSSINYWDSDLNSTKSVKMGTTNISNSDTNDVPFELDQSTSIDGVIGRNDDSSAQHDDDTLDYYRFIVNKTNFYTIVPPARLDGFINEEQLDANYQLHTTAPPDATATTNTMEVRRSAQYLSNSRNSNPKQMQFTTEYYESFVHPAMFTHDNPERVAIVGRGDTMTSRYTLKEVLKHKTVKEVYMIGMDNTARPQHLEELNEWDDCGMFLDQNNEIRSDSQFCMDDPRVRLVEEDSMQWFLRQFPLSTVEKNEDGRDKVEESCDGSGLFKFDVLILDIFDLQNPLTLDSSIYSLEFLESVEESLAKEGILVSQAGIAPRLSDPDETYSRHSHRAKFINGLTNIGFESIMTYDIARNWMTPDPVSIVVAFQSDLSLASWFSSEARENLKIQKRIVRLSNDNFALQFFDSATKKQFQYPSKASEVVYCRQQNEPMGCMHDENGGRGLNLEWPNYRLSDVEVKRSGVGENAGRGVFAKVDIPAWSYVGLESTNRVAFEPDAHECATMLHDSSPIFRNGTHAVLNSYIFGYGYQSTSWGKVSTYVEPGPLTFVNHGCNGTHNIDFIRTYITEATADLDYMPVEFTEMLRPYNPALAHENDGTIIFRDVKRGEEILGNYLTYIEDAKAWRDDVQELRDDCSGEMGAVERYQGKGTIYNDREL